MNTTMQFEALSILRPLMQSELKRVGPNWWFELVVPYLAWRNQDRARTVGPLYVSLMGLSEVLQVLMKNWRMIADRHGLDPRYFGLLAHLKSSRNAYAHAHREWAQAWDEYDRLALDLIIELIAVLKKKDAIVPQCKSQRSSTERGKRVHDRISTTTFVKVPCHFPSQSQEGR